MPTPQASTRRAAEDDQVDHRLGELEIKLTFLEDLVDQLNLTIYRQQQDMDRLRTHVQQLQQHLPEGSGAAATRNLRDELPPHY